MLSPVVTDKKVRSDAAVWIARHPHPSLKGAPRSGPAPRLIGPSEAGVQETRERPQESGQKLYSAARNSSHIAVVQQQLGRILRSKAFIKSEKLCRFLRFVVEHVLTDNSACLKEYLVGVEVYDRKPPYDPSQDSIVRTEARRLRNKLKEYYATEGRDDPMYIYLRPGSYVPTFQPREEFTGAQISAESSTRLPPHTATSIVIAILPFEDMSKELLSSKFARGIPDELAYRLMLADGCSVVSPSFIGRLAAEGLDVFGTMRRVGAQIAFQGSARAAGSRLRVTARIISSVGAQLWSDRIDVEVEAEPCFAIEEHVAKALAAGWDAVRTDLASRLK